MKRLLSSARISLILAIDINWKLRQILTFGYFVKLLFNVQNFGYFVKLISNASNYSIILHFPSYAYRCFSTIITLFMETIFN